jgi:hypothetical protein
MAYDHPGKAKRIFQPPQAAHDAEPGVLHRVGRSVARTEDPARVRVVARAPAACQTLERLAPARLRVQHAGFVEYLIDAASSRVCPFSAG